MEKYDVIDATLVTGGGEYPTQDGFGWTNGVLRKLLALYPTAVAPPAGTSWCAASPANDNIPPTAAEPGVVMPAWSPAGRSRAIAAPSP
jgi:alpha,alpha-trehalase